MEGVELLEKMMKGYRGAILMISHDRTLLDQVCNQIWELDRAAVRVFDGNYSDWASQKERERGFQEFEYQQYQKEKGGWSGLPTPCREKAGKWQSRPNAWEAASGCSTKALPLSSRVMCKAINPLS